MNTDLVKRLFLVSGSIFFVGGCILLVFVTTTITIQNTPGGIIGSICFFAFTVFLFYMSIDAFIKYGMLRGIDYAIEQQKPMTMKDVDNRIDEIVKTCDKKEKCNS